jgi:hypothetical protein
MPASLPPSSDDVRRKTEELLRAGFLAPAPDPAVRVGEPLAVMDPGGAQHSWFVPLEVGEKLAGFAQLLPSLVALRVSSFQQRPHDYEHCPDVADWTDVERIAKRAAAIAKLGEQLSHPVLTFDGSPSRLAWRVDAKSPTGETRQLFIAGTATYESRTGQGLV